MTLTWFLTLNVFVHARSLPLGFNSNSSGFPESENVSHFLFPSFRTHQVQDGRLPLAACRLSLTSR